MKIRLMLIRSQLIQRQHALDVAEQNGRVRRSWQGGETGRDMVPVLMNIADENKTHADQISVDPTAACTRCRRAERPREAELAGRRDRPRHGASSDEYRR